MKRWSMLVLIAVLALPWTISVAQGPQVESPPESFAAIADIFVPLEARTLAEGEAATALFINGEIELFYAQLDATITAEVTLEELEQAHAEITSDAPVGDRMVYRVLIQGDTRTYVTAHLWGDMQLGMIVSFDTAGIINGLDLGPVPPLPDDPMADYESAVTYRLPFDGLWYLSGGGDSLLHNHHVVAPSQRHAYDIIIWKDGNTYTGDGTQVEDYYAYGQPVLAPAAGEVVRKVDGLPNVEPQVGSDVVNLAGNYVMIQIAEGEYLLIAHMLPDSITVEVGDTVEAGQMIGRVGNSGNTTEPHIHIHLQNDPDIYAYDDEENVTGLNPDAVGLPLRFTHYLANGEAVEVGVPLGGTFAQNAE